VGVIVTCLHVIDGAESVAVRLGEETRAEEVAVRAFDVERDLAVLVVELPAGAPRLTAVALGDPTSIGPGWEIIVIGNPLGLENTATDGIVSAVRETDSETTRNQDESPSSQILLPEERLLQISAAISPGSSGGPVMDLRVEVIGVATSGLAWGAVGLNFAVPVHTLPAMLDRDDAMDLGTFQDRVDRVRHEPAIEIDYRHGKAALGLAVILFGRGDLDRTEELLAVAIDSQSGVADPHYVLGEIHFLRGQLEDAREAFEKALWEDESHAMSHLGLPRVYILVERSQHGVIPLDGEAAHHLEEFLRLSEDDPSLEQERDAAILLIEEQLPDLLD
jgi:tetratricopeptide (TPR) repeat protein